MYNTNAGFKMKFRKLLALLFDVSFSFLLILKAGTGYTSAKPDLHLLNKNSSGNHQPKFAFKHFHNYTAAGIKHRHTNR